MEVIDHQETDETIDQSAAVINRLTKYLSEEQCQRIGIAKPEEVEIGAGIIGVTAGCEAGVLVKY